MQTDWEGEYQKLNSFFQCIGISHHVSFPHAHQQNGSAERKHHHIVEVGLSLLAQASMPLKFWDEAFMTATYLINRLPSRVIDNQTPLERLLDQKPDYSVLRVFGCACWPNLRSFNDRKLQFRSKRCVFFGYSNMHKCFKCLDVSEGRVYISRDVVFDEIVFPFSELHPNAGACLRGEILLLPPDLLNPDTATNRDDFATTLLQIYLLLSLRLQVKIMEETVENLKKTDQVWGLKGLILCRSIPVWSTRRISATCDIIIWARFGGGIRLAFSAHSAITFVFSTRTHVSVRAIWRAGGHTSPFDEPGAATSPGVLLCGRHCSDSEGDTSPVGASTGRIFCGARIRCGCISWSLWIFYVSTAAATCNQVATWYT
jgi:hypothetical protein